MSIQEIEQAFARYCEAYFERRDLNALRALFSPTMTLFGTGGDEISLGLKREPSEALYRRDLEQAPNPLIYRFRQPPVTRSLGPGAGLVCAQFDLETQVLDQGLILRDLRLTLVFVRSGERWLIEHMHLSLPTEAHGGDEAFPIKELEERDRVLERRVNKRTQELQTALAEVGRLAKTDRLTGVANRLSIDAYLETLIRQAEGEGSGFAVILIDLDHFKRINDTLGHLQGDRVLTELAQLLGQMIRPDDLLGRWGGEEFIILCPGMGLAVAVERAERLRAAVEGHAFLGLTHPQTVSLGVASYRGGDTRESLIGRADAALYEAKSQGRNRVRIGQ